MKSIRKNWLSWVSIFIGWLCFAIGGLEKSSDDEGIPLLLSFLKVSYYNSIFEHKTLIVTIILLVLISIQIVISRSKENAQKEWLEKFLEHLTNQHFGGGNYNTRITIFKARKGWHFLISSLLHFVFNKKHLLSMLPNPQKYYLTIYVRHCAINQRKSGTFFRISNKANVKGTSLVAECYRTGELKECQTQSIDGIELTPEISSLSNKDKKRVIQYMNETGISDYDTLLTLNVPSNKLLSLPIKSGNNIWGVLVIDQINNDSRQSVSFKDKIGEDLLVNYQKIIQFTISLIN